MLVDQPDRRTDAILQADLLSQSGRPEVVRGMVQSLLDDGNQSTGGQPVSGRSRWSQAQMMDAACPKGLIGRERNGRAWNAGPDGCAGRSTPSVVNDEPHPREQPLVGDIHGVKQVGAFQSSATRFPGRLTTARCPVDRIAWTESWSRPLMRWVRTLPTPK